MPSGRVVCFCSVGQQGAVGVPSCPPGRAFAKTRLATLRLAAADSVVPGDCMVPTSTRRARGTRRRGSITGCVGAHHARVATRQARTSRLPGGGACRVPGPVPRISVEVRSRRRVAWPSRRSDRAAWPPSRSDRTCVARAVHAPAATLHASCRSTRGELRSTVRGDARRGPEPSRGAATRVGPPHPGPRRRRSRTLEEDPG